MGLVEFRVRVRINFSISVRDRIKLLVIFEVELIMIKDEMGLRLGLRFK